MRVVICSSCGSLIVEGRDHRFDDVRGKRIAVYCDGCCPRCWSGRREVPAEERLP